MRIPIPRGDGKPVDVRGLRLGLTLIETMVVLAIVGVLMTLLLVGIVKVRETANRTACQEHLKQIGLALHNYTTAFDRFPQGSTNDVLPWGSPRLTWGVRLFPYLENTGTYGKLDFSLSGPTGVAEPLNGIGANSQAMWASNANSEGPNAPTAAVVPAFLCPSDTFGKRVATLSCGTYSLSNYLGIFGDVRYGDGLPGASTPDRRAVFGLNYGASFAEITDGSSQTMVAAEYLRGAPNAARDLRGWFWSDEAGYSQLYTQLPPNSASPDRLETGFCNDLPKFNLPCQDASGALNTTAGARSRHPGGVNVVMADGAVQFVNDHIDLDAWRALGTISGDDKSDEPSVQAQQPGISALATATNSKVIRSLSATGQHRSGTGLAAAANPNVIPNQYVVVLRSKVADPRAVALRVAALGLTVSHVYQHGIKGFSAHIPPALLSKVSKDPAVQYVATNKIFHTCAQIIPPGITRVGATVSHAHSGIGSGSVNATIAIIDTGIYAAHPDLNVVLSEGFGFATGNDGHGHGTHVAGTAAARDNSIGVVGVAKGAKLWAIKVLDDAGSGTTADVIAGLDFVAAHSDQVHVANMSLGGGFDQPTNDAVDAATEKGVVVVVAAGNSSADAANFSPASAASAITVAAMADTDGLPGGLGPPALLFGIIPVKDDTFAPFSNYGNTVSVIAPGVNILSTWKTGGYNTISGTSQATPHVAGLAALILSTRSADGSARRAIGFRAVRDRSLVDEVRNLILGSSVEDIPGLGVLVNGDARPSYPMINAQPF